MNYTDPNGMYPDSWQRPGETAVAYSIRMNSPELYKMMYSDGGGGGSGGWSYVDDGVALSNYISNWGISGGGRMHISTGKSEVGVLFSEITIYANNKEPIHWRANGLLNAGWYNLSAISQSQLGTAQSSKDGTWYGDTWDWAKEHFYAGAEGEITYGVQLAATLKNGLGVNVSPVHEVVAQGSINNKGRIVTVDRGDKMKIWDFGAAYYVGVNYSQTIDYSNSYSGVKTNNISIGVFGVVGVTLNFSDSWNFIDGYGGIDISGKVATGWGASGAIKFGFEF